MVSLELKDFGFSYPGEAPVLQGLDLAIEEGSFCLLVGRTGCGKTTLLRCCKPEIAPVGERFGTVEVLGRTLEEAPTGHAAPDVGYVFQSPENQIVCDTVLAELAFGLENLGTDPDAMRRRVAEVASFFGIEPWLHAETAQLSGGQKQLVNLAGILAMQPRLLLLDEPTAQLDPIAEKGFLHALFRINRELGVTVVVATHAPESMADYATEVLCLERGGIVRVPPRSFSSQVKLPEAPMRPQKEGGEACIIGSDIFFRYARDRAWVLKGTDVSIEKGRIHALVGGNGSGKSTLLRLMAGVLKPERGKIASALRSRQALLPQDPKALFVCDTVHDELCEWQRACGYGEDDVAEVAKRFALENLLSRHPLDLSGGQQQNLAFAKVLLTSPDLMLLDEPTKGLDAFAKVALGKHLAALREQGVTIVLATHDLSFSSVLADEMSMLFDGGIVSTESADAFFANNLFYRYREDEFLRIWADDAHGGKAGCDA